MTNLTIKLKEKQWILIFVNQLCSKNLSGFKGTNDFHQYFYFSQRSYEKITFLSSSQQPSQYL